MSTVGDTLNYRTHWRFFSEIGWAADRPAKALFSRDADAADIDVQSAADAEFDS